MRADDTWLDADGECKSEGGEHTSERCCGTVEGIHEIIFSFFFHVILTLNH